MIIPSWIILHISGGAVILDLCNLKGLGNKFVILMVGFICFVLKLLCMSIKSFDLIRSISDYQMS